MAIMKGVCKVCGRGDEEAGIDIYEDTRECLTCKSIRLIRRRLGVVEKLVAELFDNIKKIQRR